MVGSPKAALLYVVFDVPAAPFVQSFFPADDHRTANVRAQEPPPPSVVHFD